MKTRERGQSRTRARTREQGAGTPLKGKKLYQLKLQARKLKLAGASTERIASELRVSESRVRELVNGGRARKFGENDLAPELWREFLLELTQEPDQPEDVRLVAGQQLRDDAPTRAYFRWVTEGCVASLFSADRWLCQLGLHIDDFFIWCESRGSSPWATGVEPEWHANADSD